MKLFSIVWTIVILAPLIYPTGAPALIGHPWRVELVTSFILSIFLAYSLFAARRNKSSFSISQQLVLYVIAPFAAFIIWSALSAFWAESGLSVLHHTLVWACYLIFFLFALKIASDKKLLRTSLISLGSVIGIICVSSIIEFVSKEIIEYRYAKFAEIFAALLPLFFSFILRSNRKYLLWSILATVSLWLGILFSLSRAAFLASVAGLSVFVLLRIFSEKTFTEKRRLIFAASGIIFIAVLTQILTFPANSEQKGSTFSRIVIKDEKDAANSISLNARFLFTGVAKEMFFSNYLVGVGADNFGLEFNKYRAVFSAKPANESTANLQEHRLPQRAHNEFLQILAELGFIGALIILWLFLGIVKLGFAEIKNKRFGRADILTQSAIGGIAAFLFSSLFSSFSFRLMQNGLVFFFLLAILLRNYAVERNRENQGDVFIDRRLKPVFFSIALAACLALIAFSALKAASEFFVYRGEQQEDFAKAKTCYEDAIWIDSANASANYLYGLRLFKEADYQESAVQMRQTVNKGINTSVNYSHLISSLMMANRFREALDTNAEAVKIFPYSIFLRVRYAVLLKQFGKEDESRKQFEIAVRIDEKQAETWSLVINNGTLTASREARVNKKILSLDELTPSQAIYTVLTERQVSETNEKIKK